MPLLRAADTLENEWLRVDFDVHGITGIVDKNSGQTVHLSGDGYLLHLNGQPFDSDAAKPAPAQSSAHQRVYRRAVGPWTVDSVYELQPGWRFVSKHLVVHSTLKTYRVGHVQVLRGQTDGSLTESHRTRSVVFLHLPENRAGKASEIGLFMAMQNPFLDWQFSKGLVSMSYPADMDWELQDGPFVTDRVCIGTLKFTGTRYSLRMVPEWKPAPAKPASDKGSSLDWGEIQAMTDCVSAFSLDPRKASVRVHVGWCENDYQIDVGTPQGREEYKRIIDQAAAMGCKHILFSPANSAVSSLADNKDAWGWENVLWLALGQKIRTGQWDVHRDPIPPSVTEMLDYAKSKDVKFLAYVYPSMPFMQDPAWTAWIKEGQPGGYRDVDTGIRSFQNWLLDQLVAFSGKTGVSGYSFDHWWIAYDGATSHYAQWYGCRRVLEELRRRLPQVVIDGRQQYQGFGPWTWLAGTYPHPTSTDEQPESFRAFPDLHFDRVCGDRQRFAAWWYRIENFCPTELVPGFITHQTERTDAHGVMRRDRFRAKDWDVLGWKYSLISSIATAPFNHVVDMIPARDKEEFNAFSKDDQAWFRSWLDWTDKNMDVLRNVRPILNQPMFGHVDGTAAFKGDHGFIFLFNPNYPITEAALTLDESIGFTGQQAVRIRQLYPDAQKGRLIAGPHDGSWKQGDKLSLAMPGVDAMVFEVIPAPQREENPCLFGTVGAAHVQGDRLELTGVRGVVGETHTLQILLPGDSSIKILTVNGAATSFKQSNHLVEATVQFAGDAMGRCPRIGKPDAAFQGGVYRGETTLPARIFTQLAQRRRQWPVHYNQDDLLATWLGSDRLLLFVNVAQPDDKLNVSLRIDGQPVELRRAYTSIYPHVAERTFVGWYADVSSLEAGRKHTFEATLPPMAAGRFQGLFLDNVEADYTGDVVHNPSK